MDWIKVMCNILDHRKIKMIRKGPEGNTLVLLWLLMLIEAGKCDRGGYLMISDSLPYTAETLGMVTDIPLPTVQLGLATFTGLEMIDQRDGVICLKNWSKTRAKTNWKRDGKDRERQQRHRQKEREKILLLQAPENLSRDSHSPCSIILKSRWRTEQTRTEEKRQQQTRFDCCCPERHYPESPISRFRLSLPATDLKNCLRPPISARKYGDVSGKRSATRAVI